MASNSLFIMIILASVLCLAFSVCRADLISSVCVKSTNPALCNETIRSDPRGPEADLPGLGQIIIEHAIGVIKLAVGQAKLIGHLEPGTCADAIDELNDCVGYLKRFGGSSIRTHASTALTKVGACDQDFGSDQPDFLIASIKKAQDLIHVLLVIANRL